MRVFDARARARFHCDCSSERVANALRMLGRAEIESILAEQGMVGVTCEFCNRSYSSSPRTRSRCSRAEPRAPPHRTDGVR